MEKMETWQQSEMKIRKEREHIFQPILDVHFNSKNHSEVCVLSPVYPLTVPL